MEFQLTQDQQDLLKNHGVIDAGQVIVMTVDVYRDMLGIATDEDYADSVSKINEGVEQHEAGEGIPLNQFAKDFNSRHGIQD